MSPAVCGPAAAVAASEQLAGHAWGVPCSRLSQVLCLRSFKNGLVYGLRSPLYLHLLSSEPHHCPPDPPPPPPSLPLAQVDLACVYEGLLPGQHVYRLRALVGSSAAQHVAVVRRWDRSWAVLGGGRSGTLGSWGDARVECIAGRVAPRLLFFDKVA